MEAPLASLSEGRVLVLTLNRPERLNALTPELHHALHAALEAAASDPEVGAVVLTGAGRGFCAGGDLAGGPRMGLEEKAESLVSHARSVRLLHEMPKPTLAAVNGAAAGAGLALALACDVRIMAQEAQLTTAYARLGLSGDLGITWFLNRLVGPAQTKRLMFLSEKIGAEEALALGLASRLAPADAVLSEAQALAAQLADGPPLVHRYVKGNLAAAETRSLADYLPFEAFAMARCGRTQDAKEAGLAYRERRPPVFKGV